MKTLYEISNKIISSSKLWIMIVAIIVFVIFSITVLPDQSAKAEAYSADVGSPDLSFFYAPTDLYRMAEAYGPEGRLYYVRARFTFDLVFPLVYGAFLMFTSAWALKELTIPNSRWRLLLLIPLLAVLFDLLENIAAAAVIGRYPQPTNLLAAFAPFFTLIKWIFVGSGFVLIVVYLVLIIWRRLKK